MKKLLQLMFTLNGRVSRKVFLWYHLFALIAVIALVLIEKSTFTLIRPEFRTLEHAIVIFLCVFLLIWGIGNIAVSVKRLQDLNRSAALLLLHFIPVFGSIGLVFYLGCTPSYRGHSRHGPPA